MRLSIKRYFVSFLCNNNEIGTRVTHFQKDSHARLITLKSDRLLESLLTHLLSTVNCPLLTLNSSLPPLLLSNNRSHRIRRSPHAINE